MLEVQFLTIYFPVIFLLKQFILSFCSCFPHFSLKSCIFGFPVSLLHPNTFIPNTPSSLTTSFYQLFSQSTTKQGEGILLLRGLNIASNIVHELLPIAIPQCSIQTIISPCSGKGQFVNRGRKAFRGEIFFSNDTEVI